MNRSLASFLFILVCLLPAVPPAAAAGSASPLWGELEPGPYAVGFRQLERYDHTRPFRLAVDLTGAPPSGERARPLRISVWYPAQAATGPALTLGDYVDLIGAENRLGEIGAVERTAARTAFYGFPLLTDTTPEQRRRLEGLPSRAFRDARPAAGRFPVVLYSLGSAAIAHVTPELLASHGYVVAQAPRLGAWAGLPPDNRDRLDLETKLADYDFLLNALAGLPQADLGNLATVGFSAGGRWALAQAMKNPNVKAVVSLDSVMLFDDSVSREWRALSHYDPDAVRVPVLHVVRREWVPQETADLWGRLRYAERTHLVYETPKLDHLDFQSIGYATALVGLRPDLAPAVTAAFHQWNRLTLDFLDAHVKGDAAARDRLARGPEGRGAAPGFVTITPSKALPAPWTEAHFWNALDQRGPEATLAAYRRLQRESGQPPLPERALNLAGYLQLAFGNVPAALDFFNTNAEAFPRSANAHDSLADGYLAAGDPARARDLSQRARALLEADSTITAERRELIRQSLEARLKELDKGGGKR